MNSIAVALLSIGLSLCTAKAAPPVRLEVGSPQHKVEPKSSAVPGYRFIEYRVRLINDSSHAYYFVGTFDDAPSYRQYVRKEPKAAWVDGTQIMCGVGAGYYSVRPHASVAFTVRVPADELGHQLLVAFPVHASPSYQSWFERRWPRLARSNVVTIR